MNYSEVMAYAVQLDTWKQRLNAIIEYNNLSSHDGYKITITNNTCYLDPPSFIQNVKRWYYGYNKEQFYIFLNKHKPHFFDYLNNVKNTTLFEGRTPHARKFISNLIFFLSELARACSVCRQIYPEYELLNTTLINYYHGIRDWIASIGY